MYKRLIAIMLICIYVYLLPVRAYALTYNDFLIETASGKAKVEATAKLATARYVASRGILRLVSLGSVYFLLALSVYSAYEAIRDKWQVGVTLPSSPTFSPTSAVGGQVIHSWGSVSSNALTCQYTASTQPVIYSCNSMNYQGGQYWDNLNTYTCPPDASYLLTGGRTELMELSTQAIYSGCPATFQGTVKSYQITYYYHYMPSSSYAPTYTHPSPVTDFSDAPNNNIQAMANTVEQANTEIATQRSGVENTVEPYRVQKNSSGEMSEVPLPLTPASLSPIPSYTTVVQGDYTVKNISPQPMEAPAPFAETPPSGGEETPPETPNTACTEYQRTKQFDFSGLLQSAQSVPLLGLLDKLVINPAGEFSGKVNFQLSNFGSQEIDLTLWKYNEIIGVIRFFVLGTAFIVAIRVIYD